MPPAWHCVEPLFECPELPTGPSASALPAAMAEDTIYFVKTVVDADTIELSATQGGAILPITGVGDGDLQKFTPEVFAGQGTYQVSSYPISLPG